MTEEEKDLLKETKARSARSMVSIGKELKELAEAKKRLLDMYFDYKRRFEDADMKLALETKLTVVKRGRKSETTDSLEAVLQNKEKVKKLIILLREEVNSCTQEKKHGELTQGI